jgi:hypothetical protein
MYYTNLVQNSPFGELHLTIIIFLYYNFCTCYLGSSPRSPSKGVACVTLCVCKLYYSLNKSTVAITTLPLLFLLLCVNYLYFFKNRFHLNSAVLLVMSDELQRAEAQNRLCY